MENTSRRLEQEPAPKATQTGRSWQLSANLFLLHEFSFTLSLRENTTQWTKFHRSRSFALRFARISVNARARCSGLAALRLRRSCVRSNCFCSFRLARSAALRCSLGDSRAQSIPLILYLRYAKGEVRLAAVGQIQPRSLVSRDSVRAISRPVQRV